MKNDSIRANHFLQVYENNSKKKTKNIRPQEYIFRTEQKSQLYIYTSIYLPKLF